MLTSTNGEDTSSYIYDKAGRTLLANDKGDCTRTIYDNLGRTIQEISPEDYDSTKDGLPAENTYADATAGQTYKYAANGTLTSETNRLGKTTTYYYNDIGSKVREEFDIYKFYYLNHGELYQVKVAIQQLFPILTQQMVSSYCCRKLTQMMIQFVILITITEM